MNCPHCKSENVRAYVKVMLTTDPELLSSAKMVKKTIMDKRTEIIATDWAGVKVVCKECRQEI